MNVDTKKKIIIIGAGISGMSAGIYAMDNNYDVTIYEKHYITGGQCTGWTRKNTNIDGCAHWVVGTNPNSLLFPLWKHVGAFDEDSKIYKTDYFCKFDIDGEIITFYSDLEKLKEELLRVAPEDKRRINTFINLIKAYKFVQIPTRAPLDKMNIFSLMVMGIKMLPMVFPFMYYKHVSIYTYANKFKSNILKKVFSKILSGNYNVHSLLYIMQSLAKNDAGMPEGGSTRIAKNIERKFIKNGGKIITNSEVDKIIINDNVAKGIILKNGEKVYADYVISATDAHHTLYNLLDNRYDDKYFNNRFNDNINNPLILGLYATYKVNINANHLPKMMCIDIPSFSLNNYNIDSITIRNYSFDKTLNNRSTTFSVLINVDESVYDYLKNLSKEDYKSVKLKLAMHIQNCICNYYKLNEKDIEYLDLATPLTYERYTNAYKGSYMSFLTTNKVKGLMRKGYIKGIDNLILTGQWLMPPGGLPIALFTAKHAIYRICKLDHKKFIDLDNQYNFKKLTITSYRAIKKS